MAKAAERERHMSQQKDLTRAATAPRSDVEALWQRKLPQVPVPPLHLQTLRRALAFELQSQKAPSLNQQTKLRNL